MRSWSLWIRWWSWWVLSSPSRIMASVGKYTMPWIIDRAISALLLTNSWPGLKGHIILKNISANMAASMQSHLCSLWSTLVSLLPCDKWSSIPSESNERLKIYSNNRLSYTVLHRNKYYPTAAAATPVPHQQHHHPIKDWILWQKEEWKYVNEEGVQTLKMSHLVLTGKSQHMAKTWRWHNNVARQGCILSLAVHHPSRQVAKKEGKQSRAPYK